MTIDTCTNCGGTHYGVNKCPFISKPCVVCGTQTIYACSDCTIDNLPNHVCENPVCQHVHERESHCGIDGRYASDCRPDPAPVPRPKTDFQNLAHGVYRIWWIDGGSSVAAVGSDSHGERWFAPTNWITVPSKDWALVDHVRLIETQRSTS